jgi:hypothetical protein
MRRGSKVPTSGHHVDTQASMLLGRALMVHAHGSACAYTLCMLRARRTMQAALGVVLWVVNRLQNHAAPTFQLAISVLQVLCEVSEQRRQRDIRVGRSPSVHSNHSCTCSASARCCGLMPLLGGPKPACPAEKHAPGPQAACIRLDPPQTKSYYLLTDSGRRARSLTGSGRCSTVSRASLS